MILIDQQEIIQDRDREKIVTWEVWFYTPMGLCKTHEAAMRAAEEYGFDPNIMVVPTPVAVGAKLYEAYIRG